MSDLSIYTSSKVLPYIYKLTHKETYQFYYGYREANNVPSSEDLGTFYFSSSNVINKLGFENFNLEIIAEFYNGSDAWEYEQTLIEENIKNPLCINKHFTKSGKSQWRRVGPLSEETKLKMSLAWKTRIVSEETKLIMSQNRKGKKQSAETIASRVAGRSGKMSRSAVEKSAFANRKFFTIMSEDGEIFEIHGIVKWCVAHGVNTTALRIASKNDVFSRGYKIIGP